MGEQEGEEERKRREPTFPVLSTDFTHIISSDLHVGLGGVLHHLQTMAWGGGWCLTSFYR